MIFTIVILKEVKIMTNAEDQTVNFNESRLKKIRRFFFSANRVSWFKGEKEQNKILHPFRVILNKEISDYVMSWRFIILIALLLL